VIELMHVDGELIFSEIFKEQMFQLSTEKLSAGIYLLRVTENGQTETYKIIK